MIYEISLRIMEGFDELATIYVGTGIVCIRDGTIEGYVSRDYISGSIFENNMNIETIDGDFGDGYDLSISRLKKIELPGYFILNGGRNVNGYIIAELVFGKNLPEDDSILKKIEEIKKLALNFLT